VQGWPSKVSVCLLIEALRQDAAAIYLFYRKKLPREIYYDM
jgi:hypothetical protein